MAVLQRRLGFELLGLVGGVFGASFLARSILRHPQRARIAKRAVMTAAVAAPILLYPRKTFAGRAVVVTGGSRGLGLAIARALLKQNASVTLLARDADELDRAKALLHHQVPESANRVFTVHCDVTVCEQLDLALAEARARFGRIDALINNAGSIAVGPFGTLDNEDFKDQVNLHLRAVVESMRLIHPYLHQNGGGHIVNISSVGGLIPMPHMSAYNASKFALGGFSEAVGAELRHEGIFVTTVYPGLMRTGSPIQAIFKGDPAKEYSWFSVSDNLPGLSMSADRAARQILRAAANGQARLVLSLPAKLGNFVHAVFPEIFLTTMSLVTTLLPKGDSKERTTGAESREQLEAEGIHLPTEAISRVAEAQNNQQPANQV